MRGVLRRFVYRLHFVSAALVGGVVFVVLSPLATFRIAPDRKLELLMSERTVRGDILPRLGREKEAGASFLDEIRFYPVDFEAYQNLVLLCASQRREREVHAAIEEMMAASPGVPSTLAAAKFPDLVGDGSGARKLWNRTEKVTRIT